MKMKKQLEIGRLIGKIDNDFNISESDWIPRVAAWCIDALSQMKILPMEKKKRKLEVSNRIANFPCMLNAKELKVYDENGCEIDNLDEDQSQCGCGSKLNSLTNSISDIDSSSTTGTTDDTDNDYTIKTIGSNTFSDYNDDYYAGQIAIIDVNNKSGVNFMKVGNVTKGSKGKNYVISGNNIELNFDADYITVESFETATYYDDYYDCEVPYIYDNGLLLEALAWWCLFKYLSRGSKHPVYDLKSNSQVLNPYLQWLYYRPKAKASVESDISKSNDGWNNFFYNSTFLPRL